MIKVKVAKKGGGKPTGQGGGPFAEKWGGGELLDLLGKGERVGRCSSSGIMAPFRGNPPQGYGDCSSKSDGPTSPKKKPPWWPKSGSAKNKKGYFQFGGSVERKRKRRPKSGGPAAARGQGLKASCYNDLTGETGGPDRASLPSSEAGPGREELWAAGGLGRASSAPPPGGAGGRRSAEMDIGIGAASFPSV